MIGAANAFKERSNHRGGGRGPGSRTTPGPPDHEDQDLHEHPLLVDDLQQLIWQTTDQAQYAKVQDWTMGQLKEFLLTASEPEIKGVMYGLTSDTIGCVPKLMSNQELTALGQKIFNELPGTRIQGQGIHGRADPAQFPRTIPRTSSGRSSTRSPTRRATSSSAPTWTVTSVVAVERALKDIVDTFRLGDIVPWCVLSIDVQAEVERAIRERSPRCSRASPEQTTATRHLISRSRRS